MNKSKNTMSLKNLAFSLKKSIDFDLKKSNTMATSKSTVQLKPYSIRQESKFTKYGNEEKLHIPTSDTDNPNPI